MKADPLNKNWVSAWPSSPLSPATVRSEFDYFFDGDGDDGGKGEGDVSPLGVQRQRIDPLDPVLLGTVWPDNDSANGVERAGPEMRADRRRRPAMLALPQDYVRQVLGNARFLLARRRDAEMLDEAIATASPEANHAMAVWDPQGKGYCAETVAYDLANLATNAIHQIRVNSTRNNPVNFAFEVEVGDYVFRMRGTQLHRGGDILAKVAHRVRSAPLDGALDTLMVRVLRRGGRIYTTDSDGVHVVRPPIPFDQRSW